jgi:hypothetical protein
LAVAKKYAVCGAKELRVWCRRAAGVHHAGLHGLGPWIRSRAAAGRQARRRCQEVGFRGEGCADSWKGCAPPKRPGRTRTSILNCAARDDGGGQGAWRRERNLVQWAVERTGPDRNNPRQEGESQCEGAAVGRIHHLGPDRPKT